MRHQNLTPLGAECCFTLPWLVCSSSWLRLCSQWGGGKGVGVIYIRAWKRRPPGLELYRCCVTDWLHTWRRQPEDRLLLVFIKITKRVSVKLSSVHGKMWHFSRNLTTTLNIGVTFKPLNQGLPAYTISAQWVNQEAVWRLQARTHTVGLKQQTCGCPPNSELVSARVRRISASQSVSRENFKV